MASTETALLGAAPFARGLTLRNRVVMAPMTTWSGHDDGTVSAAEEAYYRRRVQGVGLVVTGCTAVTPGGIGFTGEFAAHDDRFIPSLARLAAAARSGGAPAVLQIFHAGNKAAPALVPGGDIVSASAVTTPAGPFSPSVTPRALAGPEIQAIIRAFAETTRRAVAAGFDGVELHGAHGFLIQNFLSPRFNQRDDGWGGSLEKRMRFPLAVVDAVRQAIADHADRPFLLGYRLSPEEPEAGGLRLGEALALVDRLVDAGIDYLHGSLSDAALARPLGQAEGPTITRRLQACLAGRVPLVVAGQARTPAQAQAVLQGGADLVAIGQGLVMNPDWVERARQGHAAGIETAIAAPDAARLGIPAKLWAAIEATPGWFTLRQAA
ncbi:NADH-dependent flavin oxidoreductase [Roseomonas sp. 18066]|uniref:NADH-dependent flavin oxidoreductase n=1 Tax=Roseomonas sp. 18066 TaxID=2681412 RepID=UPI00135B6973|nr:NADH-dependent flavin oxidoreductase [Roseomonas sp. 18066]